MNPAEVNPFVGLATLALFLVMVGLIIPILPSIGYSVTVSDASIETAEAHPSSMNAYDAFIGISPLSTDREGNKRLNITIRSTEDNEVVKTRTDNFGGTFTRGDRASGNIYMREEGPFAVEIEFQEFDSDRWRTLDRETIELAY